MIDAVFLDNSRFSQYRVMWVMVFFDLPTGTKRQRKAYSVFRNSLLKDGFSMLQFSIYVRHCASVENANVHMKRVRNFLPKEGNVIIVTITDKQFSNIEIYNSLKQEMPRPSGQQLELF